ncbi:cyclic nucleotide-binding domain-containing protein [Chitinophaga oryziterrae]|uniref:Cyclic nucleotide-binding domain-containing protein n=1 Tax=Chitinophaga oryziterrae TaxID=1031224 RepID=A0A6N8JFT1_9BACT|nr:Crp/Fnr family transcriptional regulator [Chitinophaga oryziterrae]MVT42982.1 cyclic nucleotide-binding domain-containing protein [Chitinophaga oryziterrae]
MDKFFLTVSQFTDLSADSKQELSSCLEELTLPKGHILVKQDAVCNFLYFIDRGLTRTYYLKDGKDVTDWISDENSFACSIISFITRKPDRRIIELLEPSVLFSVHYNDLESLCSKHHDIENFFRNLVSFGLVQLQQKFDDLHFASALQRYQTLMTTHPTFIQRVPLGMIASYLGITQETLSRIRSQI